MVLFHSSLISTPALYREDLRIDFTFDMQQSDNFFKKLMDVVDLATSFLYCICFSFWQALKNGTCCFSNENYFLRHSKIPESPYFCG